MSQQICHHLSLLVIREGKGFQKAIQKPIPHKALRGPAVQN